MPTRLDNLSDELQRAKKGVTPAASLALTMLMTYADVLFDTADAVLDVGGAPWVCVRGVWVVGSGATLTLLPHVSQDGVTFMPIPVVTGQTGTNGVVTAYPHEIQFAKADWGNAATVHVPLEIRMNSGWRYLKFQAKQNDVASGSPTLTLHAVGGTGN
jgi:hypothetical protein